MAEDVAVVQARLDRDISPIILTPSGFRSLRTTDRALYERILKGKILIEEYYELSV